MNENPTERLVPRKVRILGAVALFLFLLFVLASAGIAVVGLIERS
jgi:hypothetical protein